MLNSVRRFNDLKKSNCVSISSIFFPRQSSVKDFKDQIASDVVSIIVTCVRAAGKMLGKRKLKMQ